MKKHGEVGAGQITDEEIMEARRVLDEAPVAPSRYIWLSEREVARLRKVRTGRRRKGDIAKQSGA